MWVFSVVTWVAYCTCELVLNPFSYSRWSIIPVWMSWMSKTCFYLAVLHLFCGSATLQCSPMKFVMFAWGTIMCFTVIWRLQLVPEVVKMYIPMLSCIPACVQMTVREILCNPPFSLLVSAVVLHAAATRGRRCIILLLFIFRPDRRTGSSAGDSLASKTAPASRPSVKTASNQRQEKQSNKNRF